MHRNITTMRASLLVFLTHNIALPLLKIIRKPQLFPYTRQQLLQMEECMLGNELIRMLDKNKLQLLPYYAKHDIKHILLGYDTTAEGEVCLQCFMLGNRHVSFPVIATVLFGILLMPEHWKVFIKAYKRGGRNDQIECWNWFSLLELPTESVIQRIND